MYKHEEVRALMEKCRKDWDIPGIAVAVIKDGEVFFSEGAGFRDLDSKLPMDSNTVMPIASSTKPFATTVIAMLEEEGLINWDMKVRDCIPEFALKDEYASNHVTLRDLACHRTGVPRHDLMMYNTELSIEELVKKIRYLDNNMEIRQGMQYQNQMFMTLGYIIEKVTGKRWTEVVREKIFAPLGMDRSNFTIKDSMKDQNWSKAYLKDDSIVKEIPLASCDAAGTAGAINSTLTDMSRWVQFHLNKGMVSGNQLVSTEKLEETHTPQVVIRDFTPFKLKEVDFTCYGLGWFLESYRGHKLIHHGGTIDGFEINVSFMPEEGIGVVLFTNLNRNMAFEAINYGTYDIMLELERIDWSGRFLQIAEDMKKAEAEALTKTIGGEASEGSPMTHPLEAYTGEYEDAAYGRLEIKLENNDLKVYYHGMVMLLKHKRYDIFTLCDKVLGFETFARFHMNMNGEIDVFEAGISFEMLDKGIMFRRV